MLVEGLESCAILRVFLVSAIQILGFVGVDWLYNIQRASIINVDRELLYAKLL